ncbi:hypothetical protein VTN02DRAFT_6223 [Thermoascus thermophilus]
MATDARSLVVTRTVSRRDSQAGRPCLLTDGRVRLFDGHGPREAERHGIPFAKKVTRKYTVGSAGASCDPKTPLGERAVRGDDWKTASYVVQPALSHRCGKGDRTRRPGEAGAGRSNGRRGMGGDTGAASLRDKRCEESLTGLPAPGPVDEARNLAIRKKDGPLRGRTSCGGYGTGRKAGEAYDHVTSIETAEESGGCARSDDGAQSHRLDRVWFAVWEDHGPSGIRRFQPAIRTQGIVPEGDDRKPGIILCSSSLEHGVPVARGPQQGRFTVAMFEKKKQKAGKATKHA